MKRCKSVGAGSEKTSPEIRAGLFLYFLDCPGFSTFLSPLTSTSTSHLLFFSHLSSSFLSGGSSLEPLYLSFLILRASSVQIAIAFS